ncbi:MAG: hypothetical protein ACO2OR_02320 [Desulfurococcaceae archaeon]
MSPGRRDVWVKKRGLVRSSLCGYMHLRVFLPSSLASFFSSFPFFWLTPTPPLIYFHVYYLISNGWVIRVFELV